MTNKPEDNKGICLGNQGADKSAIRQTLAPVFLSVPLRPPLHFVYFPRLQFKDSVWRRSVPLYLDSWYKKLDNNCLSKFFSCPKLKEEHPPYRVLVRPEWGKTMFTKGAQEHSRNDSNFQSNPNCDNRKHWSLWCHIMLAWQPVWF